MASIIANALWTCSTVWRGRLITFNGTKVGPFLNYAARKQTFFALKAKKSSAY